MWTLPDTRQEIQTTLPWIVWQFSELQHRVPTAGFLSPPLLCVTFSHLNECLLCRLPTTFGLHFILLFWTHFLRDFLSTIVRDFLFPLLWGVQYRKFFFYLLYKNIFGGERSFLFMRDLFMRASPLPAKTYFSFGASGLDISTFWIHTFLW